MSESRLYTIIGLMSGTSMDGVDAAVLYTDGRDIIRPGATHFLRYDDAFRAQLRSVLGGGGDVDGAERGITEWHIRAIEQLMDDNPGLYAELDYIALHGHTILHDPARKKTWQIGDAAHMAQHFQCPVVHNFRARDVAMGGHGAPLVPVFHAALAAELPKPAIFVNIGGVSNITYIGMDGNLLACDTGPGNALIDDVMQHRFSRPHDEGGIIASSGSVQMDVLKLWLADPFFAAKPPKSLDRDHFKRFIQSTGKRMGDAHMIATLAALTAHAIASIEGHLPDTPHRWIITGGGRHNRAIMSGLDELLPAVAAVESIGWDGDFIEAWAFAYLAARRVQNLPISFPSTTGVPMPISGGEIADV